MNPTRRWFVKAFSGAILTILLGVKPWRLEAEDSGTEWVTVWQRLPEADPSYPLRISVHGERRVGFDHVACEIAGTTPAQFAKLYSLPVSQRWRDVAVAHHPSKL